MRVLDELRDDHASIETMLAVLEACAARFENGRALHPDIAGGVLGYFRRFVVACHCVKEEAALYPRLIGRAADAAMVRRLQTQHAATAAAVETLTALAPRLASDDAELRKTFAGEVRGFTTALREHHRVEISWVRESASALLTDADDETIVADFGRIARETIGPTGPEYYRQVVADYRDIASTWGS